MKKIIEAHKFFMKESKNWYKIANDDDEWEYNEIFYYMYFPIAYLKFMFLTIFDK